MHAEHLGHFLALQNVPKINAEFESTLFLSLCNLFTRDKVLSLYENTLTDVALRDNVLSLASEDKGGADAYPSVFVNFHKTKAGQIVSLLRKLLDLFDLDVLRYGDIVPERGSEPRHMVFLYLIQLLAVFVSSCMEDKDLATILSVASATFLEVNYCDPLCAATLAKPMFIPYYDQQVGKKHREGQTEGVQEDIPEARLKYYRLFTGYELDSKGSDVSCDMDYIIRWTDHSLLQRMQGCKIVERKSKKFWFVAPQMGDRMVMVKKGGLKLMGGQTGNKALKICSYLMSDNVMAYMQCAVFGTITNMLPCHANSDFTESVMTTIKSSMTNFTEVVRHQSANLMAELSRMSDSCLSTTGVGFAGQEKGNVLYFGKVFTGPEDKRPAPSSQARLGLFTSVTLGMTNNTMMKSMLTIALKLKAESKINPNSSLHSMLSMPYKPVAVTKVVTDASFYGRYHHRFNTGEFTEVACVKAMNDPRYNNLVHEENLTNSSKYQLTLSHGALPMCTLTLSMTIRQTAMMVLGFLCTELARVVYAPKITEVNLCKHLISLSMAGKFRHGKDEESQNVFDASYGTLIKLTGPAFCNPGVNGVNYHDLDSMEWLQAEDNRLPDYIHRSLNMIGDTKKEVRRIMQEKNMSYNRVLFISEMGAMKFATVFANDEYMIHAPMMVMSSMRIFSNNNNNNSYGSVKLCRQGAYYRVKVFSNRCVDTTLYSSQRGRNGSCDSENKSTIDEMVERIKRGVSCVLPRIDVNRIKMLTPELNEKEFGLLVSAVKKNNIEVIGQEPCSYSSSASCSTWSEGNSRVSPVHWAGMKRATEEHDGSPEKKKAKAGSKLTICDEDVDFGFDDSD